MTKVIADEVLRSRLYNLTQPLELCDESGRVVAQLFPTLDLSQYEPLNPQVSDEELLRRSQSDEKTYTTAQVIAYLEKL